VLKGREMLGSGSIPEIPKDFCEQLARNSEAGPISLAFAKVLDAENNLHQLRLRDLEQKKKADA